MFSQILVPTDFSKKHASPLEIATNIATKYKSTIHLLHVVEPPSLNTRIFTTNWKNGRRNRCKT